MIWKKTMSQKPIEFYYSNASSGRQQQFEEKNGFMVKMGKRITFSN